MVASLGLGRLEEAAAALERAAELAPEHAETHSQLGLVYESQERLKLALGEQREAVRLAPMNPVYEVRAGSLCRQLRWFDEARAALLRALDLQPEMAEAYNEMGALLEAEGRPGQARDQYEVAVRLAPDEATYHRNLGVVYKRLKRYDLAANELRIAVKLRPGYAEAYKELTTVSTLSFITRGFSRERAS